MNIVQLTVGEYPHLRSVAGSQVLANAISFRKMGHEVMWIAVVPWTSIIIEKAKRLDWIRKAALVCAEHGIRFELIGTAISIMRPHSFPIRNIELDRLAARLQSCIAEYHGPVVLHCRSYYAADLGIRIKRRQFTQKTIVSFDMRSAFPEEMPLTMKWLGKLMYGYAKEWEARLLRESDIAFLPLNHAREHLYRETGACVRYAAIAGFDRAAACSRDFDDKWRNRKVAYVGSIGVWNASDGVVGIFERFRGWGKYVVSLSSAAGMGPEVHCLSLDHDAMPTFFSDMLALVIPADDVHASYFWNRQLRLNRFSTKAAEALSMGVPLVVDSRLFELAEFVRQHECGLVYSWDIHGFEGVVSESDAVGDAMLWKRLSANAGRVSHLFQRETVLEHYLQAWEGL
jgi:hypothetical protein